ncbi:alpha/beta fold hydrolase [Streptomyces sp. NPDC091972]|uniref:alpha/beta fold hydrolase n=1 Tax=Streptomyces sp. NPDC091972 TaxID=3366007 RepID=UPI003812E98C
MAAVHVIVWDDREGGGAGAPALFVHNLLSWCSDPTYGFAGQRPLAAGRRLLLMDRRGYGHSPDTVRSDFQADAEDVVEVLDEHAGDGGGHLVGHGNGGVVADLRARKRPGRPGRRDAGAVPA